MDNNKEQTMQNWKKVLILDPVLNSLFQSSLDVKDFLHQKILTLDYEQIVAIYSKLSSVRHALSKSIQKQVQTKHQFIEKSFLSKHQIESRLKLDNVGEIESLKNSLESYNMGYQVVRKGSVKLQNLTKVIRFSKALEKLKINVRLLRTFMKDHLNTLQSVQSQLQSPLSSPKLRTPVTQQSINLPKVAKLLKQITQLITKNDFTGIKYYQQQKGFINNAKQTLYMITEKQLSKTIEKYREMVRKDILENDNIKFVQNDKKILKQKMNDCVKDIKEKLNILHSINKLRQFIPVFGKGIFTSTSQQMKILFQQTQIQSFQLFLTNQVLPLLLTNSNILIKIQQTLHQSSLSQHLQITYNLPNLFMKYLQHLVSYWRNLINWNMEQDVKEMEKRRLQAKVKEIDDWEEKEMGEIIAVNPLTFLVSHDQKYSSVLMKYKTPLWYKYPILFNGLSVLVNKLHEQVLLHAEYNSRKYQFSQKKQSLMSTLIPLARRFYQKIDCIILNQLKLKDDKDQKADKIKSKVQNLKWIYDIILFGFNNQSSKKQQGFQIVTVLNEKVIKIIQKYIQQQIKKQNNLTQFIAQSNQVTQHFINHSSQIDSLFKIINRKENFMLYNNLQITIDHLKRVKFIKQYLSKKQQNNFNHNHREVDSV